MHEADHSHVPAAQVANVWSCTSTPLHVFIAWFLITKDDFPMCGAELLTISFKADNCEDI
jgi:hypothetical protein